MTNRLKRLIVTRFLELDAPKGLFSDPEVQHRFLHEGWVMIIRHTTSKPIINFCHPTISLQTVLQADFRTAK